MEEPTIAPTKRQPTKLSGKQVAMFWLVILAIVGFFIIKAVASPKAKYSVSDIQYTYVDPATVSVSFKVTNSGKASGQPWCTISAHDDNSSHYGNDRIQLSDTIKPGDTKTTAGPLTITEQGASLVTKADVTCD